MMAPEDLHILIPGAFGQLIFCDERDSAAVIRLKAPGSGRWAGSFRWARCYHKVLRRASGWGWTVQPKVKTRGHARGVPRVSPDSHGDGGAGPPKVSGDL